MLCAVAKANMCTQVPSERCTNAEIRALPGAVISSDELLLKLNEVAYVRTFDAKVCITGIDSRLTDCGCAGVRVEVYMDSS